MICEEYNGLASQSWNKWQLIDKISFYSENNTLYSCIVTTYSSSINIFSKQTLPISISELVIAVAKLI